MVAFPRIRSILPWSWEHKTSALVFLLQMDFSLREFKANGRSLHDVASKKVTRGRGSESGIGPITRLLDTLSKQNGDKEELKSNKHINIPHICRERRERRACKIFG